MDEKKSEKIKIQFGKQIRHFRESNEMTQLDLAVKVGLDVRQIKRIENGQVNTSLTSVYALIKALGVSPDELLGFKA